jgi:calcineurin-like phosphoesterase family protein
MPIGENMNYWITTDTHFGHANIKNEDFCNRPDNYEELILKRLKAVISPDDVLIHLGDVSWKNDIYWHDEINSINAFRRYLVKGNHDTKSNEWYFRRGWHFAGDSFTLKIYGKTILFSHVPVEDSGYHLNIHGHFHNTDHRKHEPELVAIKNEKQVLLMLEHEYKPFNLKNIVGI